MTKELQDKTFNLSIKTIATIGGFLFLMIGEYIVLHDEINVAMKEPEPEITRIEFDYQKQIWTNEIAVLKNDIQQLKNDLKSIK